MTPVRIELGLHLLGALEVEGSETAAFTVRDVCSPLSCIRVRCIGWQAPGNG